MDQEPYQEVTTDRTHVKINSSEYFEVEEIQRKSSDKFFKQHILKSSTYNFEEMKELKK